MFEKRVAKLINEFLGKFLEQLDDDELNISAKKGDISLRNVRIRQDALDYFGLPITVSRGYVGKLVIKVPWWHLKTEPTILEIEDVVLVLRSKREQEWNEVHELQHRLEGDLLKKKLKIKSLENRRLKRKKLWKNESSVYSLLSGSESDASKRSGNKEKKLSFGKKLMLNFVERVLDNIIIQIKNVHICYEDSSSSPSSPFSFGITMESLIARSADSSWQAAFLTKSKSGGKTDSSTTIRKLLKVTNFSMYLNSSKTDEFNDLEQCSLEKWIAKMKDRVPRDMNSVEHDFMIHPMNARLRMEIDKRMPPKLDYVKPRVDIAIDLPEVFFNISDFQYTSILYAADYMSKFKYLEQFRRFRPPVDVTPSSDPVRWWQYAISSVRLMIREQLSSGGFSYDRFLKAKAAYMRRLQFIQLYSLREGLPWRPEATKFQLESLSKLEVSPDVTYEEFVDLVKAGEREIVRDIRNRVLLKKGTDFLDKLLRSRPKGKSRGDDNLDDSESDISIHEYASTVSSDDGDGQDDALLAILSTDPSSTQSFPEHYELCRLRMSCELIQCSVCEYPSRNKIAQALVVELKTEYIMKANANVIADVHIGELEVFDRFTEDSYFPRMFHRRALKTASLEDTRVPIVQFSLQKKLRSIGAGPPKLAQKNVFDLELNVVLQPIDLIISTAFVVKMAQFFAPPALVRTTYFAKIFHQYALLDRVSAVDSELDAAPSVLLVEDALKVHGGSVSGDVSVSSSRSSQERPTFHVDVHMLAPNIILSADCCDAEAAMVVVAVRAISFQLNPMYAPLERHVDPPLKAIADNIKWGAGGVAIAGGIHGLEILTCDRTGYEFRDDRHEDGEETYRQRMTFLAPFNIDISAELGASESSVAVVEVSSLRILPTVAHVKVVLGVLNKCADELGEVVKLLQNRLAQYDTSVQLARRVEAIAVSHAREVESRVAVAQSVTRKHHRRVTEILRGVADIFSSSTEEVGPTDGIDVHLFLTDLTVSISEQNQGSRDLPWALDTSFHGLRAALRIRKSDLELDASALSASSILSMNNMEYRFFDTVEPVDGNRPHRDIQGKMFSARVSLKRSGAVPRIEHKIVARVILMPIWINVHPAMIRLMYHYTGDLAETFLENAENLLRLLFQIRNVLQSEAESMREQNEVLEERLLSSTMAAAPPVVPATVDVSVVVQGVVATLHSESDALSMCLQLKKLMANALLDQEDSRMECTLQCLSVSQVSMKEELGPSPVKEPLLQWGCLDGPPAMEIVTGECDDSRLPVQISCGDVQCVVDLDCVMHLVVLLSDLSQLAEVLELVDHFVAIKVLVFEVSSAHRPYAKHFNTSSSPTRNRQLAMLSSAYSLTRAVQAQLTILKAMVSATVDIGEVATRVYIEPGISSINVIVSSLAVRASASGISLCASGCRARFDAPGASYSCASVSNAELVYSSSGWLIAGADDCGLRKRTVHDLSVTVGGVNLLADTTMLFAMAKASESFLVRLHKLVTAVTEHDSPSTTSVHSAVDALLTAVSKRKKTVPAKPSVRTRTTETPLTIIRVQLKHVDLRYIARVGDSKGTIGFDLDLTSVSGVLLKESSLVCSGSCVGGVVLSFEDSLEDKMETLKLNDVQFLHFVKGLSLPSGLVPEDAIRTVYDASISRKWQTGIAALLSGLVEQHSLDPVQGAHHSICLSVQDVIVSLHPVRVLQIASGAVDVDLPKYVSGLASATKSVISSTDILLRSYASRTSDEAGVHTLKGPFLGEPVASRAQEDIEAQCVPRSASPQPMKVQAVSLRVSLSTLMVSVLDRTSSSSGSLACATGANVLLVIDPVDTSHSKDKPRLPSIRASCSKLALGSEVHCGDVNVLDFEDIACDVKPSAGDMCVNAELGTARAVVSVPLIQAVVDIVQRSLQNVGVLRSKLEEFLPTKSSERNLPVQVADTTASTGAVVCSIVTGGLFASVLPLGGEGPDTIPTVALLNVGCKVTASAAQQNIAVSASSLAVLASRHCNLSSDPGVALVKSNISMDGTRWNPMDKGVDSLSISVSKQAPLQTCIDIAVQSQLQADLRLDLLAGILGCVSDNAVTVGKWLQLGPCDPRTQAPDFIVPAPDQLDVSTTISIRTEPVIASVFAPPANGDTEAFPVISLRVNGGCAVNVGLASHTIAVDVDCAQVSASVYETLLSTSSFDVHLSILMTKLCNRFLHSYDPAQQQEATRSVLNVLKERAIPEYQRIADLSAGSVIQEVMRRPRWISVSLSGPLEINANAASFLCEDRADETRSLLVDLANCGIVCQKELQTIGVHIQQMTSNLLLSSPILWIPRAAVGSCTLVLTLGRCALSWGQSTLQDCRVSMEKLELSPVVEDPSLAKSVDGLCSEMRLGCSCEMDALACSFGVLDANNTPASIQLLEPFTARLHVYLYGQSETVDSGPASNFIALRSYVSGLKFLVSMLHIEMISKVVGALKKVGSLGLNTDRTNDYTDRVRMDSEHREQADEPRSSAAPLVVGSLALEGAEVGIILGDPVHSIKDLGSSEDCKRSQDLMEGSIALLTLVTGASSVRIVFGNGKLGTSGELSSMRVTACLGFLSQHGCCVGFDENGCRSILPYSASTDILTLHGSTKLNQPVPEFMGCVQGSRAVEQSSDSMDATATLSHAFNDLGSLRDMFYGDAFVVPSFVQVTSSATQAATWSLSSCESELSTTVRCGGLVILVDTVVLLDLCQRALSAQRAVSSYLGPATGSKSPSATLEPCPTKGQKSLSISYELKKMLILSPCSRELDPDVQYKSTFDPLSCVTDLLSFEVSLAGKWKSSAGQANGNGTDASVPSGPQVLHGHASLDNIRVTSTDLSRPQQEFEVYDTWTVLCDTSLTISLETRVSKECRVQYAIDIGSAQLFDLQFTWVSAMALANTIQGYERMVRILALSGTESEEKPLLEMDALQDLSAEAELMPGIDFGAVVQFSSKEGVRLGFSDVDCLSSDSSSSGRPVEFELKDFSSSLSFAKSPAVAVLVDAGFNLMLRCFNSKHYAWEPAVERTAVSFSFEFLEDSPGSARPVRTGSSGFDVVEVSDTVPAQEVSVLRKIRLGMNMTRPLLVNLSHDMLSHIITLASSFAEWFSISTEERLKEVVHVEGTSATVGEVVQSKKSKRRARNFPVRVRNLCGMPVSFGPVANWGRGAEVSKLAPGDESEMELLSSTAMGSLSPLGGKRRGHMVPASISQDLWTMAFEFGAGSRVSASIERYGLMVYNVRCPTDKGTNQKSVAVVVKVSFEDGIRTVAISSPIVVQNNTDASLMFAYSPEREMRAFEASPYSTTSVPIDIYGETGILRMAVKGEWPPSWSSGSEASLTFVAKGSSGHGEKGGVVVCPRSADGSGCETFFSVTRSLTGCLRREFMLQTVVVRSPLGFINLMPCMVRLQLYVSNELTRRGSSSNDLNKLRQPANTKPLQEIFLASGEAMNRVDINPDLFVWAHVSVPRSYGDDEWNQTDRFVLLHVPQYLGEMGKEDCPQPSKSFGICREASTVSIWVDHWFNTDVEVDNEGSKRAMKQVGCWSNAVHVVSIYATHWFVNRVTAPVQLSNPDKGPLLSLPPSRDMVMELASAEEALESDSASKAESRGNTLDSLPVSSDDSQTGNSKLLQQYPSRYFRGQHLSFFSPARPSSDSDISSTKCMVSLGNMLSESPVSMDGLGIKSRVSLRPSDKSDSKCVKELSWAVRPAPAPFSRTKIVTVSPLFVVLNKTSRNMEVATALDGRPDSIVALGVDPVSRAKALVWNSTKSSQDRLVYLRLSAVATGECTGSFSSALPVHMERGTEFIRVPVYGVPEAERSVVVRVRYKDYKGTFFVLIEESSEACFPYRVRNTSSTTVTLSQRELSDTNLQYTRCLCDAGEEIPYAFQYLQDKSRKVDIMDVSGKLIHSMSLDTIGYKKICTYTPTGGASTQLQFRVAVDGNVKLLLISEFVETKKSDRKREKEIAVRGNGGGKESVQLSLSVVLKLSELGVSIIDARPVELVFLRATDIACNASIDHVRKTLSFTVDSVQVDNQLLDTQFPVILRRPKDRKSSAAAAEGASSDGSKEDVVQPFIQLSVVQTNDLHLDAGPSGKERKSSGQANVFQYFSVLVQEMEVYVDESIVYPMMNFIQSLLSRMITASASRRNLEKALCSSLPFPKSARSLRSAQNERLLYVQRLELHPLKTKLTIRRNDHLPSELRNQHIAFRYMFGGYTDLENVSLNLNAMIVDDLFGSSRDVQRMFIKHYKARAMMEIYKVVGSLEMIGNPVGLVTNIGSGLRDFFYEPALGLTQSPQEFATGVARGTFGLVKHSVHGVFNVASKISGTLGKLSADASMDDDYVRNRVDQRQAKHVGDGVVQGGKALVRGLGSGLGGIVLAPMKGAKESGAKGFFKGVGKGLAGMVAKPVGGVLSFTSKVTEGIKNTPKVFESVNMSRSRPPRAIPDTGLVSEYNYRDAGALLLLYKLRGADPYSRMEYILKTVYTKSAGAEGSAAADAPEYREYVVVFTNIAVVVFCRSHSVSPKMVELRSIAGLSEVEEPSPGVLIKTYSVDDHGNTTGTPTVLIPCMDAKVRSEIKERLMQTFL